MLQLARGSHEDSFARRWGTFGCRIESTVVWEKEPIKKATHVKKRKAGWGTSAHSLALSSQEARGTVFLVGQEEDRRWDSSSRVCQFSGGSGYAGGGGGGGCSRQKECQLRLGEESEPLPKSAQVWPRCHRAEPVSRRGILCVLKPQPQCTAATLWLGTAGKGACQRSFWERGRRNVRFLFT
jgi:hypothetical protein